MIRPALQTVGTSHAGLKPIGRAGRRESVTTSGHLQYRLSTALGTILILVELVNLANAKYAP